MRVHLSGESESRFRGTFHKEMTYRVLLRITKSD